MDCYKLEWKKSAVKELKKISKEFIPIILETIQNLSSSPIPSGAKKLSGSEKTYRVRVGMYRIIYDIFEDKMIIQIIRVRHRKDVYKK